MPVNINIPAEKLRERKLFVATPMYGGQCTGIYTKSIADLSALCTHYGIQLQMYFRFNESLITRARNYCVDEFLRGQATHLMFIDSDIGFNPQDVLILLALQADESDYDVIGGPYPKKCIRWDTIKRAVERGVADADPNELEKYVGDYVFNRVSGGRPITLHDPAEVMEIGTGFMMIRRKTFEHFQRAFPQYRYRPDHAGVDNFDGSREITMYFQAEIDPKSARYLSEDYWFCQKIREIGHKTWLCPWMRLEHVGSYVFGGAYTDLSALATKI
ncbi:MAG: hypothetical protein AABY83_07235 [Pseudomonadota bacterium]